MAEKYIIHGATFNGDGTTSAEAASNGGVGAWNALNSLIFGTLPSALPGAAGTIAAGDNINIRSKTAAGADITIVPVAANIYGSAAATENSWITWRLDDGDVWAGIDGTLVFAVAAAASTTTTQYNRFICNRQDAWVFRPSLADTNGLGSPITNNSVFENILVDASAQSSDGMQVYGSATAYGTAKYINLHYKTGNEPKINSGLGGNGSTCILINPWIEIGVAPAGGAAWALIGANSTSDGASTEVYGGKITGAFATSPLSLVEPGLVKARAVRILGLKYPSTMLLGGGGTASTAANTGYFSLASDGSLGSIKVDGSGEIDSRQDGNFPTLNATQPDSASTPWSWKVYPRTASQGRPQRVEMSKVYSQTAAALNLRLQFLVADTFDTLLSKGSVWLDVLYFDTSGDPQFVSSRVFGSATPLDSDTAGWSATTYGAIDLIKRKIDIATPTAVKQDTMIFFVLNIGTASATAADVLFVDPDVQST